MSAKVDQFCNNLRDRLNTAESRLKAAKKTIQAIPGQAEKVVREKLEEAHYQLHTQKERIDQTRANLKARAEQKMAETKEAVSEWKAKREARKLNDRAERAATYAADAVDCALAAIDEADVAILDAVVARIDADAVQATPASR